MRRREQGAGSREQGAGSKGAGSGERAIISAAYTALTTSTTIAFHAHADRFFSLWAQSPAVQRKGLSPCNRVGSNSDTVG